MKPPTLDEALREAYNAVDDWYAKRHDTSLRDFLATRIDLVAKVAALEQTERAIEIVANPNWRDTPFQILRDERDRLRREVEGG